MAAAPERIKAARDAAMMMFFFMMDSPFIRCAGIGNSELQTGQSERNTEELKSDYRQPR